MQSNDEALTIGGPEPGKLALKALGHFMGMDWPKAMPVRLSPYDLLLTKGPEIKQVPYVREDFIVTGWPTRQLVSFFVPEEIQPERRHHFIVEQLCNAYLELAKLQKAAGEDWKDIKEDILRLA